MRVCTLEAHTTNAISFTEEAGQVILHWKNEEGRLDIDALAFGLEVEKATLRPLFPKPDDRWEDGVISGSMDTGSIRFTVRWQADGLLLRKQIFLYGRPEANWGALLRLVVHEGSVGLDQSSEAAPPVGWRDDPFTPCAALNRKPEEGSGSLPGCGYPVFFKNGFAGLEHPMGFNEASEQSIRFYHHPIWSSEELASQVMIVGRAKGQVEDAFARYFATLRRSRPTSIAVEINTFWTDPVQITSEGVEYGVDLQAYRAIAHQWINHVLEGEQGLITGMVLDAGWSDRRSIYAPKPSIGGLGDEGLASFAEELQTLGLSLGLWISANGSIGVDPTWAQSAGYSTSTQGLGAAYSASTGTPFICWDDVRWQHDFMARVAALNTRVPVRSYKCDWENEGITSTQQSSYALQQTVWEENVNVMIQLYDAISPRSQSSESASRMRGAWWLSPWWFRYVDSTHLPHSGDLEYCSLPTLTPREAALNSRDLVLYEHLIRHRTPLPWNVIDLHDFAHAPRCPVLDSDESWLHMLLLWITRGAQTIQLYLPPYGIRGWRAQALRQTLRWLRDNESFLINAQHEWLGGNPGIGELYGFYHYLNDESLIILRNPLGYPQAFSEPLSKAIQEHFCKGEWAQLYPERAESRLPCWMGSNEILIFHRRPNNPASKALPAFSLPSIPHLHRIGPPSIDFISSGTTEERWHVHIPYEYDQAELILEWERNEPIETLQIAVGRYEDGLSSAPLPITWLRSNWRTSYTEARSKLAPSRVQCIIARAPLPVGGAFYISIRKPFQKPATLWIETLRGSANPPIPSSRALPCPQKVREAIVHCPIK